MTSFHSGRLKTLFELSTENIVSWKNIKAYSFILQPNVTLHTLTAKHGQTLGTVVPMQLAMPINLCNICTVIVAVWKTKPPSSSLSLVSTKPSSNKSPTSPLLVMYPPWIYSYFPTQPLLLYCFSLCCCTVSNRMSPPQYINNPHSTLWALLSGTFLQTLPDLVTPLKGHSLSLHNCPVTWSAPSKMFGYW